MAKQIPPRHSDVCDEVTSHIESLRLLQLKFSNLSTQYRNDYTEDHFGPVATSMARALIEYRRLHNYLVKVYPNK